MAEAGPFGRLARIPYAIQHALLCVHWASRDTMILRRAFPPTTVGQRRKRSLAVLRYSAGDRREPTGGETAGMKAMKR